MLHYALLCHVKAMVHLTRALDLSPKARAYFLRRPRPLAPSADGPCPCAAHSHACQLLEKAPRGWLPCARRTRSTSRPRSSTSSETTTARRRRSCSPSALPGRSMGVARRRTAGRQVWSLPARCAQATRGLCVPREAREQVCGGVGWVVRMSAQTAAAAETWSRDSISAHVTQSFGTRCAGVTVGAVHEPAAGGTGRPIRAERD